MNPPDQGVQKERKTRSVFECREVEITAVGETVVWESEKRKRYARFNRLLDWISSEVFRPLDDGMHRHSLREVSTGMVS